MASWRLRVAGLVVGSLVLSSLVAVPGPVTARAYASSVDTGDDASVPGGSVPTVSDVADPLDGGVVTEPEPAPVWPGAGAATVSVDSTPTAAVAGVSVAEAQVPAQAGVKSVAGLAVSSPSSVDVEAFDRSVAESLGVAGVVFRVSRADEVAAAGPVEVSVDYSTYANAFGAGFSDRLGLFRLPGCAVSTPEVVGCTAQPVWVESTNDQAGHVLTASVDANPDVSAMSSTSRASGLLVDGVDTSSSAGEVLALASTASSGSTGDFRATDLRPAGQWQVGLSSGGFSYSYPVPTPPRVAGDGLDLAFTYSSQAVDGFTASTNNQSGWVGLGWDLSPGFIERRFVSCAQDLDGGENSNQSSWGDLCWDSPDAGDSESDTNEPTNSELFISLQGQSTRIVLDHDTMTWKTQEDFGWQVNYLSGAANSESYWEIRTLDGARYRFGYRDDSMLRVPAVGDDSGEPCHSSYPGSCYQVRRWNLDWVVDPNENETTLYWVKETNYYKRWVTGNILSYDRAAYLDYIDYGYNASMSGSVPVGRTDFATVYRCVERTVEPDPVENPYASSVCPSVTSANASSYPDVPVDLVCSSSSCGTYSPSFFSLRRLDYLTTYSWNTADSTWSNINRLFLRFKTVDPSGLTPPVFWLDYIRPIGLIGADANQIRMPVVDFDGTQFENRVDYDEATLGVAAMWMPRITAIKNGFGGRIEVSYGQQDECPHGGSDQSGFSTWASGKVGNWDYNHEDCYPQYFAPEDAPAGWGTFHKYLVTQVTEKDSVGGSPDLVTKYEYDLSQATWAEGDSHVVAAAYESWNDWRGYKTVRVTTGSGSVTSAYSVDVATFFQGMYEDSDDAGTQRYSTLTDYDGNVYNDYLSLRGKQLQVRHYQLVTNATSPSSRVYAELASQRTYYTRIATGDGDGWYNPVMARVAIDQRREKKIADGTWRVAGVTNTYDSYGLVTEADDWGQSGVSDNLCTAYVYARRNTGTWYMMNYVESATTYTGDDCATGTVIAKTETLFDGYTTLGSQLPYDGNPTEVRIYSSASVSTATHATYDGYGRAVTATDATGAATTTTFSPTVNFPVSGITATNALGHAVTTWPSRYTGAPDKVTDANGKTTEYAYDQLGRLTGVYLPTEPASGATATATFAYTTTYDGSVGQPTAPVRVSTSRLQSGTGSGAVYTTSYAYLDGLGRSRETQTTSPAGGRIVAVTTYDARGLTAAVSAPVHNTSAAGSGLLNPTLTALPSWRSSTYESLGRAATVTDYSYATAQRATSTAYYGDHTETTPPVDYKTVTWADVRGQTTSLQEYTTATAHQDTAYTYDLLGRMTAMSDSAGNAWSTSYNWAGQVTSSTDPDKGTTQTYYDSAGRLDHTVDARGITISSKYDTLSRTIERWQGAVTTGTKLASWSYDPTGAKGQLGSSTRWVGGSAYVTATTGFDDRYRPTATAVTIPAAQGSLAGTYTTSYGYDAADHVVTVGLPAAGGLSAETLTTGYTSLGLPDTLTSNLGSGTTYVSATGFDATADLTGLNLKSDASITRSFSYDVAFNRLASIGMVTGANTASPVTVQDDQYAYDLDNTITSITDAVAGQAQCFQYDSLDRLTQAWTTTASACQASPTQSDVGGTQPYWQTYSYDGATGNRTGLVAHATAGDTTTSYTYPSAGGTRPHAVSGSSTTGPSGSSSASYSYDATGNTTGRPGPTGVSQTLTWDAEGHLAAVGSSSSYLYTADGSRLVSVESGVTTVYLGHTELTLSGSTVGGTRHYVHVGQSVATRTGTGLSWLGTDHHATAAVTVDDVTVAVTRRRLDPFGSPRGAGSIVWPDLKGFVGGDQDPTGLTHLGAREYDPGLGRFVSVDPVLDLSDPQQWNGYAYADSNPTTGSDPSGLMRTAAAESGADYFFADYYAVMTGHSSAADYTYTWSKTAVLVYDTPGGQVVTIDGMRVMDDNLDYRRLGQKVNDLKESATAGQQANPNTMVALACNTDGMIGCSPEYLAYVAAVGQRQACGDCARLAEGLVASGGGMAGSEGGPTGSLPGFGVKPSRVASGVPSRIMSCNSFDADTPVLMADGTTEPIEDVEVGDRVLVTDPWTGRTAVRGVSALHRNRDVDLTDVTVVDSRGRKSVLDTTAHHPFWDATTGSWTDAVDLRPGDRLLTPTGATATVSAVRTFTASQVMYNLTIADTHTYYVIAGNTPVLVHNDGGWTIDPTKSTAVMRGGPFGAMYYQQVPDSKGNVYWWSPDKAGHGGSAWKVYRETATGLEWHADADANGDFMQNKYKGNTGKSISFKDLKTVNVKGLGSALGGC